MRGLRNRLSAIYQIAMSVSILPEHEGHEHLAISLIVGLAGGTIQPQKALAEWRAKT